MFFDQHVAFSESSNGSGSDTDSDTTLEETHDWRMEPLGLRDRAGSGDEYNSGFSSSSSDSEASTSSSVEFDIDFEDLIDELLALKPCPVSQSGAMIAVDCTSVHVMVRSFSRDSQELLLILELNHPEIRRDPYNPVPHIICAVEREDAVFLFFEVLRDYNDPPFINVANYIDFFRQMLEGLTFLHEHRVVNLTPSISDPNKYFMVYVGPTALPSSSQSLDLDFDLDFTFDRTRYPVRYFRAELSNAIRLEPVVSATDSAAYRKDIQDCGQMISGILTEIPQVAPKLTSLVHAMKSGEFTADRSRNLFEALSKSLEPSIFFTPLSTSRALRPPGL